MSDVKLLSNIKDYVDASTDQQLIDLRSLSHFQHGSIPGAISCPLILKTSAGLQPHSGETALENFPSFNQALQNLFKKDQRLLFFCKDGRVKTTLLAPLLKAQSHHCSFLSGGYMNFVQQQNRFFSQTRPFIVLHGKTGSGKTAVLEALEAIGEPVIHLEKMAQHRGSVFGRIADALQPSSPQLANQLMLDLLQKDTSRYLFVENKGKYIGRCAIPPSLLAVFAKAPTIVLERSKKERINYLSKTYHLLDQPDTAQLLQKLAPRLKPKTFQDCRQALMDKEEDQLLNLLLLYYDQSINYQPQNILFRLNTDGKTPMEVAQELRQLTYPSE